MSATALAEFARQAAYSATVLCTLAFALSMWLIGQGAGWLLLLPAVLAGVGVAAWRARPVRARGRL